jgi:uroporphyrinogen-III synthase
MEVNLPQADSKITNGFAGRSVLAFESRRAAEISKLIENCHGRAIVVPATKEVSAENSSDVPRFVTALLEGKLDLVIFLTGVGTRALARAVEPFCSREQFIRALSKIPVLARGPKPVAALKELGIPIAWTVPEPNTWREILQVLDANKVPLQGRTVAVQEHGVPSPHLIEGLQQRDAKTITVHVYDWALPDDLGPMKDAIKSLLAGGVDVVLFTAAVQIHHLIQVAEQTNARESVVNALNQSKVASIGPVTSEALAEYGITVQFEPSHPKMGFLVKEASDKWA